eukprot:scaffold6850_cov33-Phaeocystis_antarctica.AAC.1
MRYHTLHLPYLARCFLTYYALRLPAARSARAASACPAWGGRAWPRGGRPPPRPPPAAHRPWRGLCRCGAR